MTATIRPNSTDRSAGFDTIVRRLSRQSVEKHFDAYEDVAWDDPELALDPTDRRFALHGFDGLSGTKWFLDQPEDVQARVTLFRIATAMRVGWQFENLLQRGLLLYAYDLPNGSPEFRYLHHEITEESQHSMMFQELVDRTGMDVRGIPQPIKSVAELVPLIARRWPALFFFFVLGGEDPIDHAQKQYLRQDGVHPLVERVMRIHVTEEARHISFARSYLKKEVPKLGFVRRTALSIAVPAILGVMVPLMLNPPSSMGRIGVPRSALREARRSRSMRSLRPASVAKLRRLCIELRLMNPAAQRVWKAVGLWAA